MAEGKVLGERKVTQSESTQYAAAADFCRIFERDMNRLYLLSFLLTGDHALAEKCFVRGLDDVRKSNPVFKEWADSWARRTIIRNAIQLIAPQPGDGRKDAVVTDEHAAPVEPAELAAVLALPAFERFAFVMSVLEHYSEQECSLLLGCTRAEVVAARSRALQELRASAEARRSLAGIPVNKVAVNKNDELREDSRSQIQLKHFVHLAVPA
jgi:DNA-directed RNA polymerase specialized sigma24 family protein